MSDLVITGLGAVSPAGWGVAPLLEALAIGDPLPFTPQPRPGWSHPLHVRRVPPPPTRPSFAAHPRFRRASPISHFAAAAALEALALNPAPSPTPAPAPTPVPPPDAAPASARARDRLGLVFCTMTGSVVYSRRFYEEALRDPATASPLLFPETVFNAPASHIAALLGLSGRVHTEVGDATCPLGAFATAALWLDSGSVDHCLIVAAEEGDWLPADGLALRHPHGITSEGAGALLLSQHPATAPLARLHPALHGVQSAPDPHIPALPVASPSPILGNAWAAGTLWHCIAAVAAVADLSSGSLPRAQVSVTNTFHRTLTTLFSRP